MNLYICVKKNTTHISSDVKDSSKTLLWRVKEVRSHTCLELPVHNRGSRKSSYSSKMMASEVQGVANRSPWLNCKDISSVAEEKLLISSSALSYDQKYRVMKAAREKKWGTKFNRFITLISRLEMLNKADKDMDIYIKVFQDVFFPNNSKEQSCIDVSKLSQNIIPSHSQCTASNISNHDSVPLSTLHEYSFDVTFVLSQLDNNQKINRDTLRRYAKELSLSSNCSASELRTRVPEAILSNNRRKGAEDSTPCNDSNLTDGNRKSSGYFALRWGSTFISFGSGKRVRNAWQLNQVPARVVGTCDATFMKTEERGIISEITRLGPCCEIHLDTVTVDAQNEGLDTWQFIFELEKKSKGHRSKKEKIIKDRCKGQIRTLSKYHGPDINDDSLGIRCGHCSYHMKQNLIELGKGVKNDVTNFESMMYASPTSNDFNDALIKFSTDSKPATNTYFQDSFMLNNSNPTLWAHSHMYGECEDVFDASYSESFHSSIEKDHTRDSPTSHVPELLYCRERKILIEHLKLYNEMKRKNSKIPEDKRSILPKDYEILVQNRTKNMNAFIIERFGEEGELMAKVQKRLHINSKVHIVNLITKKCSLKCTQLYAIPCEEMCSFAHSLRMNPELLVDHKYTIEGGINFFKTALGYVESDVDTSTQSFEFFDKNLSMKSCEILQQELNISIPILLPGHGRTPKGRPHKKRKTKKMKQEGTIG